MMSDSNADVLVSPLRPRKRMSDMSQMELGDMFSLVRIVQATVERRYGATSSTVSIQDGPDAGQSVAVSISAIAAFPFDKFSHSSIV